MCIRLDEISLGFAVPRCIWEICIPPQLSLRHHALKSRRLHYVYLRCSARFQLVLSKHDNSSVCVWCCSTMGCRAIYMYSELETTLQEWTTDGDTRMILKINLISTWIKKMVVQVSTVLLWNICGFFFTFLEALQAVQCCHADASDCEESRHLWCCHCYLFLPLWWPP